MTAFHELREGVTAEGTQVEKPSAVMSTAEAVSVAYAAGLDAFYYGDKKLTPGVIARHLASAVPEGQRRRYQKTAALFRHGGTEAIQRQRRPMDGTVQSPRGNRIAPDSLVPWTLDLSSRIIWFPVRHHSPACAWHVDRVIREIRPESVLIEGPRDATSLLPLILHKQTRFPVAIYTTYVQRPPDGPPRRHAAYYPLCEYSPELAAIRAGKAVQGRSPLRGSDVSGNGSAPGATNRGGRCARCRMNGTLSHSRFLRTPANGPEHAIRTTCGISLFEVSHRELDHNGLHPQRADRTAPSPARTRRTWRWKPMARCPRRAMAAAVAEEKGRVVVVTGGFPQRGASANGCRPCRSR